MGPFDFIGKAGPQSLARQLNYWVEQAKVYSEGL